MPIHQKIELEFPLEDAKQALKDYMTQRGFWVKDRRCKPVIFKEGRGKYTLYLSIVGAWKGIEKFHHGISYSTFSKRCKEFSPARDYMLAKVYFESVLIEQTKGNKRKKKK